MCGLCLTFYYINYVFKIYIALLKFDFFFFLGFTIQFIVIVVQKKDIEFALTIAAIPVTILILIMAGHLTRKESLAGMAAIIVRISKHLGTLNQHQLTVFKLDALFRWNGLFPVQTGQDVSKDRPSKTLHPGPQISYNFCCHYYRPYCRDNHQRYHVCGKFQKRAQAVHCKPEAGE